MAYSWTVSRSADRRASTGVTSGKPKHQTKGSLKDIVVKRHCYGPCAATKVAPWPIHPASSTKTRSVDQISLETACPNDARRFDANSVIVVAWVVNDAVHCKPTSSHHFPTAHCCCQPFFHCLALHHHSLCFCPRLDESPLSSMNLF